MSKGAKASNHKVLSPNHSFFLWSFKPRRGDSLKFSRRRSQKNMALYQI